MRKKILFVISNMESGGVSKSMLSLLHTIDKKTYDVDVFILNATGIFMDLLPKDINLLTDQRTALAFSRFPENLLQLLKKGYISTFFIRILAAAFMPINRGFGGYILSRLIKKWNTAYDLAVDYNGQQQLYYLIDGVNAKTKVSFFHSDYEKWDYYYSMDKKYLPKVDKIFTISEKCVSSLMQYFPKESNKIDVFENISSAKTIYRMSKEAVEFLPENMLLTVGHLCENKGTGLALQSAKILKERGIDFVWYFLGADSGEMDYKKLVGEHGLEDNIVFLGLKTNPYPYMKAAKVIVHPSKFEGKSIALDEAKLLQKPVVVTNFSTVGDQFTDGETAAIVNMNPTEVADGIEHLLKNEDLRTKLAANLKDQMADNTDEVNKLYRLINR